MSLASIRENLVVNIIRNSSITIIGGLSFSLIINLIAYYIELSNKGLPFFSIIWHRNVDFFKYASITQLIQSTIPFSISFLLIYFLYFSLRKKNSPFVCGDDIARGILFIFNLKFVSAEINFVSFLLDKNISILNRYLNVFKWFFNSTITMTSILFIIMAILGGFFNYKLFKNDI